MHAFDLQKLKIQDFAMEIWIVKTEKYVIWKQTQGEDFAKWNLKNQHTQFAFTMEIVTWMKNAIVGMEHLSVDFVDPSAFHLVQIWRKYDEFSSYVLISQFFSIFYQKYGDQYEENEQK